MAGMTLSRRSISSQLAAILAVARKEWIIFRRYPSWIIVVVIWPVLFPFGYIFTAKALSGPTGSGLSTFSALAGTTDVVTFLVIGSTIWMWLNMTLWDVGYQLRNEQMRGTLESNWLCPVWRISLMLGGSLTKLVTSLVFLVVAGIEFWLLFGVQLLRGNVALLLLVLFLVMLSIYGIGLAFASLVLRFKEPNALVYLVRGIFMILCGITYPLEVLPQGMRQAAALLPLTYAIHSMRAIILNGATFADILPDLEILGLFGLFLPIAGYFTFYFMERRARHSGSLAQY